MSNPIRLFVSYSHQDEDWCKLFYGMLKSSNFDIWIDEHKIRAGDKWNNEIDTGLLEADAALLLVSLRFMNSPFIQMEELPHILERHQAGLRLFVVLVGDYPCDGVPWLSQIERFPRGDRSLASYGSPTDPKAEEMVADIVKEITRQVNDPFISASGPQRQLARDLLSEALLRSLDATSTGSLTAKMVDSIAKVTSLRGLSLYHAVRFFVEFQLFRFEDPTSPTALMQSLNEASSDLLIGLKEGAEKGGDYSRVRIKVEPIFFMWARDREHLWQRYFENLVRTSQAFPEKIDATRTLAQIDVQAGFIAPQFLVAGLMARFDNDWKPVLQAFPRAMADADDKAGNFASLQASQWITWLMWGPSVPICRCAQWQGAYAFQFAYGDENNSLPLLEVVSNGGTPALEAFSVKTTANGRGADRVKLRAALRWAPFVLGRAKPTVSTDANAVEPTGLEEARSDSHPTAPLRLLEIANAQAALIRGNAFAANQSNGLLLQLEEMLNTGAENDEAQVYFTAYLWMMFLVAKATQDEAGPRLLSGAIYPKLPGPQGDRRKVRRQELWRHLLPVFVHANIADSTALRFQRRMLVDSSLALLHQLWRSREKYFEAADVEEGIRFHLVCASDYSGCGETIRFPANEPLAELMRRRLADESDREFAGAIILPAADGRMDNRRWGLVGHFSSCRLPDMVDDYYDYIAELLSEEKRQRAKSRTSL